MNDYEFEIEHFDVYSLGKLIGFWYAKDEYCHDTVDIVQIRFENITYELSVNLDFDTLTGKVTEINNELIEFESLNSFFLDEQFTKCNWYWTLVNNQGYMDGLQFEFTDGENWRKVQFYSICNGIVVYTLDDILRKL